MKSDLDENSRKFFLQASRTFMNPSGPYSANPAIRSWNKVARVSKTKQNRRKAKKAIRKPTENDIRAPCKAPKKSLWNFLLRLCPNRAARRLALRLLRWALRVVRWSLCSGLALPRSSDGPCEPVKEKIVRSVVERIDFLMRMKTISF